MERQIRDTPASGDAKIRQGGGRLWVMQQQGWIFKSLRSLGLESEVGEEYVLLS